MSKKEKVSGRPKVSIVVPIYNVEKYLNECVDSILSQTLTDVEVILVDDGSPDNCGKIIDEYAKKDSRVIPVHQKNSGYSAAVNKGIDMARGEYVGIIESDDWIESDMYKALYDDAKKNDADVTKSLFYYYNPTLEEEYRDVIWKNPCQVDLRYAPNHPFTAVEWPKIVGFHASIWSSIYRADFIKKIKIPETAGASYQDFPFMIEVMTKAKRITVVKKAFLHWRNEPQQGNSTSASGKKLLLMVKNNETCLKILKKSGQYEKLKEAFFAHVVWANTGFYYRVGRENQAEYYKRFRKLLMNIVNDETFEYKYFRQEDREIVRTFTSRFGKMKLDLRPVIGKVKYPIRRMLETILPSYKAINHVKRQNIAIIEQNKRLAEELEELKLKRQ